MDRNQRDDNEIEKILNEMPDIIDNRSKEEVMTRLRQDARLEKTKVDVKSLKKKRSWVGAVVGIAALLVLSLLLPSMLNRQSDKASESADTMSETREMHEDKRDDSSLSITADQEAEGNEESSSEYDNESYTSKATAEGTEARFAAYPEDVGNNTVFHMGLAGDAAASVPVTFIIPQELIEEDFGASKPTSYDLYEKFGSQLDEEGLGFSNYHPYKGELSIEGETIVQTLPEDHSYDRAPAALSTFTETLQDTFYGFREIRFENENGSLIEFDQVGEPSKPMKLMSGKSKYNYYLVKQSDGQEFLSSNFGKSYESLDVALEEMKISPNDIYTSVIPSHVNFQLEKNNELFIIKFEELLDLSTMNDQDAMKMIDGILLTAASFDVQLQFENIVQSDWNGYNFEKPLPKPVGPNLLPLLLNK